VRQKVWVDGHLTEEILEEYAFGRLPESLLAEIEEHYFRCEHCVDALEQAETDIKTIRVAFARQSLERSRVPQVRRSPRIKAVRWSLPPRWAVGVGMTAAAVAIMALMAMRPRDVMAPAEVPLASYRGGDALNLAHAAAGRSLHLILDASALDVEPPCRVEVVTQTGSAAWEGSATAGADGKLVAVVPKSLQAGQYWIRLYSENILLREFGLLLE